MRFRNFATTFVLALALPAIAQSAKPYADRWTLVSETKFFRSTTLYDENNPNSYGVMTNYVGLWVPEALEGVADIAPVKSALLRFMAKSPKITSFDQFIETTAGKGDDYYTVPAEKVLIAVGDNADNIVRLDIRPFKAGDYIASKYSMFHRYMSVRYHSADVQESILPRKKQSWTKGRLITLDDIFPVAKRTLLYKALTDGLKDWVADMGLEEWNAGKSLRIKAMPSKWEFTDNGIAFYLPADEYGYGAAGEPRLELNYFMLQDFMSPGAKKYFSER